MDPEAIIKKSKIEFEKALNFLQQELNKIRAGRLTPALVQDIKVKFQNNESPLKAWGAISCPDPQTLVIQPWEASYIEPITRALEQSGIGIQPVIQGKIIQLKAPPLTTERRKELLKVITQKGQNVFQTMRRIRNEALREIQNIEKEGEISEDEKFQLKDKLEELVDEYKDKWQQILERKNQEILSS